MSWFHSEEAYDLHPSSNITYGEAEVTAKPSDDSPSAPPSDSGFETPENYRHMTYEDFVPQHTR